MPPKPILVPARLRRPPATGWSWVDRRFVREYAAHLSRDAVLLYFFLCAVADKHGLSFYSDGTLAALLQMSLPTVISARDELLARDLIAHQVRFTQVLSLPQPSQHRWSESGQGPMQLGELLRQIAARPHPNRERSLP
jgi:helix-turn-helix protein